MMRKRSAWTKALLLLFNALLILLVLADTAASPVRVEGSFKLCQSNICAKNSNGLQCPKGTVIHIRNMSCSTGSDECSRSSYVTLRTLCEGSQRCDASGLKALLPEYCQATEEGWRNVLVSYLCIAESQVETSCRKGGYKKLNNDLGVIRSPKLGDTGSNPAFCEWATAPGSFDEVKVTVHLVSSRMCCTNCVNPSAILTVMYLDCVTGQSTSKEFCEVQQKGVQLRSCGKVVVRSSISPGEEGLDDFVVFYEKMDSWSQMSSLAGVSLCVPPRVTEESPNAPSVAAPPKSPPRTSPVPSVIARNFGPADGMLDHKDSTYVHDADAGESGPISKNLKLLILYISFGAIILVLLIALIAVIVSYRRISKVRQSDEASGEKTALWRQDDTPLDTFQTNSSAGDSGSHVSEATYSFRTNPNADQVVATVHNDGIFENDGPDHRVSTGSGISTFLSGKRDSDFKDLIKKFQTGSFDVYSSPDENKVNSFNRDGGLDNYPDDMSGNTFNDIYEVIDRSVNKTPDLNNHEEDSHLVDHQDLQPLVRNRTLPSDDLHYCINNDEYAIVRKNRKPAKPVRPSLLSEAENLSSTPPLRSEGVVDFRPTSGPYDKQRGLGVESQGAKGKGWNYEF